MKTCIFSIIKNEHKYLKDFLNWHQNIDTIFLIEDLDSKSHLDIVSNFKNVILLSVSNILKEDTSKLKKTKIFYMECIRRGLLSIQQNYDFDWCFSIDADEFIESDQNLNDILESYKEYEALVIPWINYGYSGYIFTPIYNKPIWEIYTEKCGFTDYDLKYNFTTKVCYNMRTLQSHFIHGNHHAACKSVITPDIHLNHYITKSFEEFMWKLKIRGITAKGHRGINDFFQMHPNLNKNKILKQYYTVEQLFI